MTATLEVANGDTNETNGHGRRVGEAAASAPASKSDCTASKPSWRREDAPQRAAPLHRQHGAGAGAAEVWRERGRRYACSPAAAVPARGSRRSWRASDSAAASRSRSRSRGRAARTSSRRASSCCCCSATRPRRDVDQGGADAAAAGADQPASGSGSASSELGLDAVCGARGRQRASASAGRASSSSPPSRAATSSATRPDLLLEVDEAQDVDIDKFDKELRPMAASTGATTVFYGTAWDDANLLERAKQAHLEAERRDGVRRHFEYDWQTVAACNPAYGRYVAAESGSAWAPSTRCSSRSTACSRCPAPGRLLSPTQLSLLRGSHARLDAPVAGRDLRRRPRHRRRGVDGHGAAAHDATVLTIGRVVAAQRRRWQRAQSRWCATTPGGRAARRAATARWSRCCARPGACSASPSMRRASASRWRRSWRGAGRQPRRGA